MNRPYLEWYGEAFAKIESEDEKVVKVMMKPGVYDLMKAWIRTGTELRTLWGAKVKIGSENCCVGEDGTKAPIFIRNEKVCLSCQSVLVDADNRDVIHCEYDIGFGRSKAWKNCPYFLEHKLTENDDIQERENL